jgi:Icc-related predicted phosphoesterase
MDLNDRILKATQSAIEKIAHEEPVEKKTGYVMRAVEDLLEKAASADEPVVTGDVTDEVLKELGLYEYLRDSEKQDVTEEDEEESEKEEQEAEDDASEEEKMDAIKEAKEYLQKAFVLEKEATEAYNEAQLLKVGSLKVLADFGVITDESFVKLANMSYEDIEK